MAVLFCHCAYSQSISESVKRQILAGLNQTGVAYTEVADVCGLAACRDSLFESLGQTHNLKVIACYPRTMKWLFSAAGSTMPADTEIFNMRTDSPEDILSRLNSMEAGAKTGPDLTHTATEDQDSDWVPWFPVIDYDRCTGCQQCLNFCLFGVFALTEQGKVIVKHPQHCKTNCPACARVCPQAAIIFPKFPDDPINGAEVQQSDLDGQTCGVNITEALKGNLYDKLRQRNQTSNERFAVETDTAEPCDCDCNCTTGSDCDCSGPDNPQGKGCCCE